MKAVAIAITFGIALGVSLALAGSSEAACQVTLKPGSSLAQAADSRGPCTFIIPDGGVKNNGKPAELKDGDVVRAKTLGGPRAPIDGEGALRVISTSGNVRLEGVYILGSRKFDKGTQQEDFCAPGCGKGLNVSSGSAILRDVRSAYHHNQGASVQHKARLTVIGGEYDHNGSANFFRTDTTGERGTWESSTAGIKAMGSLTVRDSYFHHNYYAGIWCDASGWLDGDPSDIQRGGPTNVSGSRFFANGGIGFKQEKCVGGLIERNFFSANGVPGSRFWNEYESCPEVCSNILFAQPINTTARYNTVIDQRISYRSSWGRNNVPHYGNRIVNNDLRDGPDANKVPARVEGCDQHGVTCRGER